MSQIKFKFIVATDQLERLGCSEADLPDGRKVYYNRVIRDYEEPSKGALVVAQANDYKHIKDRPELTALKDVIRKNRVEGKKLTARMGKVATGGMTQKERLSARGELREGALAAIIASVELVHENN